MTDTDAAARQLIELRQYLLQPGQREALIELFDREFVETQEAVGIEVLGQFRDPHRPDYFVWLRGFPDMVARHESLEAFYDGPVWRRHREEANATMIDSDDVLLLRAVSDADVLAVRDPVERGERTPTGMVVIVVAPMGEADDQTIRAFTVEVIPRLQDAGCRTLGVYATESAANTFDRLPVRADRCVVWIGATERDDPTRLREEITETSHGLQECHVLLPTSRSLLDGAPR